MLASPPRGALLVARLRPADPSATSWLRPDQSSRLVATASISLHPDTRESFLSLKPPEEDAYLANIAVDPSFRRKGIARAMLHACEQVAVARGFQRLYLHVRLGDDAARALYETSGYAEVLADSWLVKLRGITPTALLCKQFGG
jgi:ribosomal protein S18 acetylase RimI-like enzyme